MRAVLSLALALSSFAIIAQAPAPKNAAPAPVATGFVGNKESKVYHLPSCKVGSKTKPENKVTFATQEEAVKAGYHPCRICIKSSS